MKIALVNKVFSLKQGGGERYAVNIAHGLSIMGHEVHLFGSKIEDVPKEAIVHTVKPIEGISWLKILSFSKKIRELIRHYELDLVYGLTQY
ncbi:MAG: hypothetical protein D6828_06740, partial [Nitrospirae bacterium]